jgi:hypothetical protein
MNAPVNQAINFSDESDLSENEANMTKIEKMEKVDFNFEQEIVLEAQACGILSPIAEKLDGVFSKNKAKLYGTPGDMPERFRQSLRDRKTIVSSLDQNITPMCPIPSSRLDKNLSASQLSFDKTYDFDKTHDFDRTHVEECTPMLPELSREPETREPETREKIDYPEDEFPTPTIERFSNFEENNSDNLYSKYNYDSKFENETSRWTDNSETLTRCNSKDNSKDTSKDTSTHNSKNTSKDNSKDAITRCSTFTSDINLKCTVNKPPMHPTPTPSPFDSENLAKIKYSDKFGYNNKHGYKGLISSNASPICGESPMTNRSFWEDPFNTSANLPIDDQITKQFEKFSSQENLVDVTDDDGLVSVRDLSDSELLE